MIRHFMIHLPVNTSGDEELFSAIRDRMTELADADESTLRARLRIFEAIS